MLKKTLNKIKSRTILLVRKFLKAFLDWEAYENVLIKFLKFLIKKNPISPIYALVKVAKNKFKKNSHLNGHFSKYEKYFSTHHPYWSAFSSFAFLVLIFSGILWLTFFRNFEKAQADWWDDTWYHAVGVWDGTGTDAKLYVNGKLVDQDTSAPSSLYASALDHTIGKRSYGSDDEWLDGKIDDVRLYNYALTAEQVRGVYNDGAVGFR